MGDSDARRGASTGKAERFAALDGVRGLAALMVALSHFVLAFHPALLGGGAAVSHFRGDVAVGHTAAIALFNPELGVAIFFVLSGFVLAASVVAKPAAFAELAVRRWVRLSLPILGTSLLVWPLAQWHLTRSVEAAPLARSQWLAINYAWVAYEGNDLARLVWQSTVDVYARSRAMYNTALWTMPVEFWGSLGLFAAYRAIPAAAVRPALGLAVALVVLALVWRTNYFGFPCGVALFEARRLWIGLPPGRRRHAARFSGPVGAALLILGVLMGGNPYAIDLAAHGPYGRLFLAMSPIVDNPVLLVHRIGAVAIVAAVLVWAPLGAALTCTPVQWLGRVSFMVYLCHVPLICSLVAGGVLGLTPTIGYTPATGVMLAAFLIALAATAEVTTRLFDAPAVVWSRSAGRAVSRWVARFRAAPA